MMNKPAIAIDFDGVLHARPKAERGALEVTGEAVPGAMMFLHHCSTAFDVVIFSARFSDEVDYGEAVEAVKEWLIIEFSKYNVVLAGRNKPLVVPTALVESFTYTATKSHKVRVTIDDRTIQFQGTFPKISDLLTFKSWENK